MSAFNVILWVNIITVYLVYILLVSLCNIIKALCGCLKFIRFPSLMVVRFGFSFWECERVKGYYWDLR